MDPAVIGDKEDQGLFGEVPVFESLCELAAGFVEPFAHGVIFGEFDWSVRFFVFLE